MKLLITLVFIFQSVSALAADSLLLDYQYGNQIFGSYLKIYSDGRISHEERTCCAPRTDEIKEKSLTKEEISALKNLITVAALGKILTKTCEGSMGDRYGSFTIFTQEEEHILRADRLSANCIAFYNTAPQSLELERFVYKYVKVQAPR